MTAIWDTIKDVELRHVVMMGTHDSGTYGISQRSRDTPDAEDKLKNIEKYYKGFKSVAGAVNLHIPGILENVVANWARAQGLSIRDQLFGGARYFDFRVWYDGSDFYIVHSKQSARVFDIVDEVAAFAKAHPKEIIILDFNHFYEFNEKGHTGLLGKLQSAIGDITAPSSTHKPTTNVSSFSGKNAIVLYQSPDTDAVRDNTNNSAALRAYVKAVWYSGIKSPYGPNKEWSSVGDIQKFVDQRRKQIMEDHPDVLYVCQCNMTPDIGMYTAKATLESQCGEAGCLMELGRKINPAWLPFVEFYGVHGYSNIFIIDDFGGTDGFMAAVVAANIAKAGRLTATNFYYDHMAWGDMTPGQQGNWSKLGYDANSWENGPPPPSGTWDWSDLASNNVQEAAQALGYSEATWAQPSPGNAYQMGRQIGDYYDNQIKWDDFGPFIQHYWKTLGWAESAWKNKGTAPTVDKSWSQLSPAGDNAGTNSGYPSGPFPPGSEKDAAAQLGYVPDTWNNT